MLDYYVGYRRRYPGKRIRQMLVLLTDKGQEISGHYQDECLFFRYNVARLWEMEARELFAHAELLPLAVLCRVEGAPEQFLRNVAQHIERIGTPTQRREIMSLARLLASLRFAKTLVMQTLRESDMLEESVIYQDILRRGEERGKEKWFGEGEKTGEKKLAFRLLNFRFGPLQPRLHQQIENLPTSRLEELSEALFELRDLKELRAWLRKHKDSA